MEQTNEPGAESTKKAGTRVFKKTSPNGKITTYLGKRDFVDHTDHIDPIDGVVLIDSDYIKENKKVFVHVLAAFRYGREDLDVLGLTFRKDLMLETKQVYPTEGPEKTQALTRLQERLLKKLGANAYPFKFVLPPGSPSSVTLQPAPGDTGKPCGVDYELKTYVAETKGGKPHKSDTVRLAIRKITYAPEKPQPQPSQECIKEFMMSPHPMHLEASLDRGMYYHGQPIVVNVQISNRSSKTCKKVKITVRQFADICLFSTAQYKCPVATLESEDGFPVHTGTLSKVYEITPLLDDNRDKRGLALDGKLKHEDTCLASSTILDESLSKENRDNLGIIVQYKVKVRVTVAYGSDIMVELPFMLTHPKPPEEPSPPPTPVKPPEQEVVQEVVTQNEEPPVDHNLIDFDTDGPAHRQDDDDLIFEDFARLRLKGSEHMDTAEA